jgi:peptidyl-prolyl cis-trans isomerase D
MTMLDRMRQHRNWLKWSLAIVCVAMVIFFIPNFLTDPSGNMAATGAVAVVEGREIRGDEFQRTYQAQIQAYRSAYGANMSDQLLRQLGVEQQILQQMVDERAALAEAERLDVTVSNDEVRQRILAIPSFQENGVFIGEDRYRQLLSMQRPPMTPSDFEEAVRHSLVVEKLRASLKSAAFRDARRGLKVAAAYQSRGSRSWRAFCRRGRFWLRDDSSRLRLP